MGKRLMQEKKLLRDALEKIACKTVYGEADGTEEQKRIDRLHSIAVTALASTTEETEMEKLLGSLKQDRKWAQANLADYKSGKLEMDAADMRWLEGYLRALENPIKYITTQFREVE